MKSLPNNHIILANTTHCVYTTTSPDMADLMKSIRILERILNLKFWSNLINGMAAQVSSVQIPSNLPRGDKVGEGARRG